MIVAKQIVPNKFWILKENDKKIGNIESNSNGYSVKINDSTSTFKSLGNIKRSFSINFESIKKKPAEQQENNIYGFSTSSYPYNAMYDVKRQMALWTRDESSKSWYAAGWFKIKRERAWATVFCPKLITLERYQYLGPFTTKKEANDKSI